MDASQFAGGTSFTGRTLTAPITLQIASVSMQSFDDESGQATKLVLTFHGDARTLVLNATNVSTMIQIYGPETDHWVGRSIELYVVPTQMGPGIRVRGAAPPQPVVSRAQPDEVPF